MEDLNKYVTAYETSFPYAKDNHAVLSAYAKELVKPAELMGAPIDICSLGIGYEVVTNEIISELEDRLGRYIVIEGSEVIIDRYIKHHPVKSQKLDIIHCYFENYVSNLKFDIIEMGFVLEHVEDPAAIVKKYSQLLKPGGFICAAVPNALSMHRVLGQRAGMLDNLYSLNQWDELLGHKRYFDTNSFKALFDRAGLEVVREAGLMLKPFSTAQLEHLLLDEEVWNALAKSGDLAPMYAYGIYIEARLIQ